MKVLLYARTSGATNSEKEISIAEQVRQMEDYCQQHGHEVVAVYKDEGHSERSDERPGFKKMMDDISNHRVSAEAVIVNTMSHWFRSVMGGELWKRELKKMGVRVIATCEPETSAAALLDEFFVAIDEYEGLVQDREAAKDFFAYCELLVGEYGSGLLIDDDEITLRISYPLSGSFDFKVRSEGGFTEKGLFDAIKSVYKHIYEVEKATSSVQSGHCPPLCNRNTTDGQYGIRCHDLGDLYLEGVHYDPIEKVAHVVVGS